MTAALLAVNAWEFEAHPEVWVLLAGVVAIGGYTAAILATR